MITDCEPMDYLYIWLWYGLILGTCRRNKCWRKGTNNKDNPFFCFCFVLGLLVFCFLFVFWGEGGLLNSHSAGNPQSHREMEFKADAKLLNHFLLKLPFSLSCPHPWVMGPCAESCSNPLWLHCAQYHRPMKTISIIAVGDWFPQLWVNTGFTLRVVGA